MKDCDLRAAPIKERKTMTEVTPEDLDRWAEENPDRVREIAKSLDKHDEVLKRLGSDYDENGVPYWDQQIHD